MKANESQTQKHFVVVAQILLVDFILFVTYRQGHSLNTQVPTCCHLSSVDYLLINQKEKKQQHSTVSVDEHP